MDELQDALKDLRDIHEPDPVSFWPPAPGWWIVLLLFILLPFFIRWWLKKKMRPNFKKMANQELKNITSNYGVQRNDDKTAIELALLMRKVLVATDQRNEVAGLIDEEWLTYLDKKSGTNLFTQGAGRVVTTVIYQKKSQEKIDVEGLLKATQALLRKC